MVTLRKVELPPAKMSVANYLGTKRPSGDFLFVSARVSALRGEVEEEVDTEAAKAAAQETVIDLRATIRQDIGSLDLIVSVEKMNGFVRSGPDFTGQLLVIDGASDCWSSCSVPQAGTPGRRPESLKMVRRPTPEVG